MRSSSKMQNLSLPLLAAFVFVTLFAHLVQGQEADNIVICPDFDTRFDCPGCLAAGCIYAGSTGECLSNDCNATTTTCWDASDPLLENYTQLEICFQADNRAADQALCKAATTCESCVSFLLSDGESTCSWFPATGSCSADPCGFLAGFCGTNTCPATEQDDESMEATTTTTDVEIEPEEGNAADSASENPDLPETYTVTFSAATAVFTGNWQVQAIATTASVTAVLAVMMAT